MVHRTLKINAFDIYTDCVRYGKQLKCYDFCLYTRDYVSIKIYEYENQIYIFKMKNDNVLEGIKIGEE